MIEKLIARNKQLAEDADRYYGLYSKPYFPLLKVTTKLETTIEMTENTSRTEITLDSKEPFNIEGDLDIIRDLTLD